MLWTAFLFGLLGSFHCIGMCGPIALALPSKDPVHLLTYNLGRTATYALLGAIMGSVGYLIPFADIQQGLSIFAGVIILSYVVILLLRRRVVFDRYLGGISSALMRKTKGLFSSRNIFSNSLIGIINGFLPCGLVYMGLVGALASGSISGGAGYMALFGLGTIPVMLAISISGRYIGARFRLVINKMIPSFLLVIALLFILRGLNLGIPYVSPKLTDSVVSTTECK